MGEQLTKRIVITKEQMILYKMGLYETIEIKQPYQVSYISLLNVYLKNNYSLYDNPLDGAPYTINITS